MVGLDRAVADPVGIGDLQALLTHRTQVQLALVHPAQQLPAAPVQLLLQLGVGQPGGLGALQPAEELLEAGPGAGEGIPGRGCRGHRRPSLGDPAARRSRSRAIPASACASSSALAVA